MITEDITDIESKIIEAAKRVFVRKGYVQTTMSDVANEVGIGRTALHYYYRTKEMLFSAIGGQLLGALFPNIQRIMDSEGTMLDKMPRIIEEYAAVIQKNKRLPVFFISEINRDPGHMYQVFLKNVELIQPIIQLRAQLAQEMEEGIIRKMPLIDILTSTVSMMIFPLLVRDPLTKVFLDGEEAQFDKYITERTPRIINMVRLLLTPENKK